ncbi:hypothetical protein INR49_006799 [Caranx melampygus]|nr:hypothetical protein INR49_006799 [Caranx melampygus]
MATSLPVSLKLDTQVVCFFSHGARQLVVFGLVLVCVGLSDDLGSSVGERPAYRGSRRRSRWRKRPRGRSLREDTPALLQNRRWTPGEDLPGARAADLELPGGPVGPVERPPVKFEPRRPDTTNRVAVRCGRAGSRWRTGADHARWLPVTEVDHLAHVLVFEAELHSCDSTLVMTDSAFIYAFTLVYEPDTRSWSPIITRARAPCRGGVSLPEMTEPGASPWGQRDQGPGVSGVMSETPPAASVASCSSGGEHVYLHHHLLLEEEQLWSRFSSEGSRSTGLL